MTPADIIAEESTKPNTMRWNMTPKATIKSCPESDDPGLEGMTRDDEEPAIP